MGSELNPTKRRFDLSMSRRTRKPLNNLLKETHQDLSITNLPPKEVPDDHQLNPEQERESEPEPEPEPEPERGPEEEQEQEGIDRKSLNQLMKGEEESSGETGGGDSKGSLGQHFSEEENQMQLVKKNGESGVKFKRMVGRYVKVLSNLIKAKHDRRLNNHRKKPILWLKT